VRTLLVITCVALCGCFQPIPEGTLGSPRWVGPKGAKLKSWPVQQIAVDRIAGAHDLTLPGWRTHSVWTSRIDCWLVSTTPVTPGATTMIVCRIQGGTAAMATIERQP
jgi:hypothetical protein